MRQLRALLRHRVQLVRLRTRLRDRIHAIASLQLPAVSRELAGDDLGLIGRR